MAEIQTNNSTKQKGTRKTKRLSTRIDLTPMVDLGFLLITFFIFTSALSNPTAMRMVVPDDTTTTTPTTVSEDRTITVIVSNNSRLFYYPGVFNGKVKEINFFTLRNIIADKKKELLNKYNSSKLTCIIKVTNEAQYKNIVDCLDEMVINDVSTYMFLDAEEKELVAVKD